MNEPTAPAGSRRINWPTVITVVSAAILIGAEVFGAAYAGAWALGTLIGLEEIGQHLLEATFVAIGIYVMYLFIRGAQSVEPFTTRN